MVGGCFEHEEVVHDCSDNAYLHNAAIEVIYNSFYKSPNYEILIPAPRYCQNYSSCPLVELSRCFKGSKEAYDLKAEGYSVCEKHYSQPGSNQPFDVVIRKPSSLENAFVINISINDNIRQLTSSLPKVKINISNENDILDLFNSLKTGNTVGFSRNSNNHVRPDEIGRSANKFSLFKSGKSYLGNVSCSEISVLRNKSVLKELIVKGEGALSDLKLLCLYRCYQSKIDVPYCEFCKNLKKASPANTCIELEKQNKYIDPITNKPPSCRFFTLDNELISSVLAKLKNVKVFEIKNNV